MSNSISKQPYKLKGEIRQFIIAQKKTNPALSCRKLVSLIKEQFQIDLSKSLINNVIKQNNLSSPVGRRRKRELKEPKFLPKIKRKERSIENGGLFFLKIADFKLSLTSNLAENLSIYFPTLTEKKKLGDTIETSIFMPLFKNKEDLWLFTGKEISLEVLNQYLFQLKQIPLLELNKVLVRLGISYETERAEELDKQCLYYLNSYVQTNFFPSAYRYLSFLDMQERFYSLWIKQEESPQSLKVQFFYPKEFPWRDDIVWQDDFSYAVEKVNKSMISTPENKQIYFDVEVKTLF